MSEPPTQVETPAAADNIDATREKVYRVRTGRDSIIVDGVTKFIRRNPQLFSRGPKS